MILPSPARPWRPAAASAIPAVSAPTPTSSLWASEFSSPLLVLLLLLLLLTPGQSPGVSAEETAAAVSTPLSLGLPVNDITALQRCQYGDMPGTWSHSPNVFIAQKWELRPFNHPQLPYTTTEGDPNALLHMGARYQTLSPQCQLKNLIGGYLDGSRQHQEGQQPVRILVFSDSTDTHFLQFVIEHHYRRLNGDTASPEYIRIFNNSRIQLHDRGPTLNHIVTNIGLDLFHMFILGIHTLQDGDVQMRVSNARAKFNELVGLDAAGKQIEPDIMAVHNVHWTLLNMAATNNQPMADLEMAGQFVLPHHFMNHFSNQLARLVHIVRTSFPEGILTMHTAAMVRHDVNNGKAEGKRAWIDRMFVTQLNDAHRLVARRLMMPIVDWDHITRGLVPRLYLYDDIHPADWISFEFYNVLLNLHADSLRSL